MASALRQLAVHGNLSALVGMIDNPDRRLADEEGFRRARAEFAALAEQMSWLRNGGLTKPAVVRAAAREAASIVAGVAGTVALLLITLTSVLYPGQGDSAGKRCPGNRESARSAPARAGSCRRPAARTRRDSLGAGASTRLSFSLHSTS